MECSQEELLSKFGRSKQFKSQKAKDQWLEQEIEKQESSLAKTHEMVSYKKTNISKFNDIIWYV